MAAPENQENEVVRQQDGYDLKIVEKDDNLECSICLLLLRDAMGTPCSHLFCSVCIHRLIGQENATGATFDCPQCRKTVHADQIYPNAFVDRLVKGSNVYCSQKTEGCEWIGTLGSFYEQHQKNCMYQIVPCHHDGCVHTGVKRKIKDHEADCKHQIVECGHCQAAVKLDDVEQHYTTCEKAPISCPQDECEIIVTREEVQNHLDQNCKFVVVSCSFARFGCPEKVLRKELDQHDESSTKQHMTLMRDYFYQSESKIQEMMEQLNNANGEINQLKADRNEITALRDDINQLTAMRNQIPRIQTEVNHMQQAREEMRENVPRILSEVIELKTEVRQLQELKNQMPRLINDINQLKASSNQVLRLNNDVATLKAERTPLLRFQTEVQQLRTAGNQIRRLVTDVQQLKTDRVKIARLQTEVDQLKATRNQNPRS